jgi:exopolyphosphatase/guanosine-5'-triphosphate,3'-diphosphate pyrophosphatase
MSLSDRNYTKADGFVLSSGEVSRQIDMYASASPDERKKIPGLPAERADIILPGAVIVKTLMKMAGHGEITVCGRGLRHGLIC